MTLARIVGTIVAHRRADGIEGATWRLVETCDHHGRPAGEVMIALDLVGSDDDDVVLLCRGSSVRWTPITVDQPVDTLVVGLIDLIDEGGTFTYRR